MWRFSLAIFPLLALISFQNCGPSFDQHSDGLSSLSSLGSGSNGAPSGQNPTSPTPTPNPQLPGNPVVPLAQNKVETISAGEKFACAITPQKTVKCWGRNAYGELGSGLGNITNVKQISSGIWHTCLLTDAGAVKCWGYNQNGQLGNGSTSNSSTPVDVIGLGSGVKQIASGQATCAITAQGGVKCWGLNSHGQLGNGNTGSSSAPVDVVGLTSGVKDIAVSVRHACAITAQETVKCWGWNNNGQLGDRSTQDSSLPVDVVGLTGIKQIATSNAYSCAVTAQDTVKCWGWNGEGNLGNGNTNSSAIPVDVLNLTNVKKVAARVNNWHVCALTNLGAVKCWGSGVAGELGRGSTASSAVPADVLGLASGVKDITTGWSQSCALLESGTVMCWGWNGDGQLGNSGPEYQTSPSFASAYQ